MSAGIIKELQGQVVVMDVRNDRMLMWYYKTASSLHQQAKMFYQANDIERTYVCLFNLVNLCLKTIPYHNQYNSKAYFKEKVQYQKICKDSLKSLELLQKSIERKYDAKVLEEEKIITDKKEQEQQQSIIDKDNNTITTPPPPSSTTSYTRRDWSNLSNNSQNALKPIIQGNKNFSYQGIKKIATINLIEKNRKKVCIGDDLMDKFLSLAHDNTMINKETCGMLFGTLVNNNFHITHVVLPKQTGTANTTTTEKEEELIDVQESKSLVALGWIHTHPTQTCFLSSVDMHTQLNYQLMMPESIAIVMAPQDNPNYGIFSLRNDGMNELRECVLSGFHPHDIDINGSLYGYSQHVHKDIDMKTVFIDLRD